MCCRLSQSDSRNSSPLCMRASRRVRTRVLTSCPDAVTKTSSTNQHSNFFYSQTAFFWFILIVSLFCLEHNFKIKASAHTTAIRCDMKFWGPKATPALPVSSCHRLLCPLCPLPVSPSSPPSPEGFKARPQSVCRSLTCPPLFKTTIPFFSSAALSFPTFHRFSFLLKGKQTSTLGLG